jgi:transcriptional regulator with XRE-family HTH domain
MYVDDLSHILYNLSMAKHDPNSLIRHLREERQRRKLSQAQLGEVLGVPQSQITRVERGASDIRLSTLIEMAHALGLEPVLIPKAFLPAVRHLTERRGTGSHSDSNTSPRRLLGNEPEDASAELG